MAAHLSLSGECVWLWNRTRGHIDWLCEGGAIVCEGAIEGRAHVAKASDRIGEVASDLIFVVAPASAHREIARMLAPLVTRHMTIVLSPGRTFGAYDFRAQLLAAGAAELPVIAETQTIVHTCRRTGDDRIRIIGFKQGVELAALNADPRAVIGNLPASLRPYFIPVDSVLRTSMSNVGMILHCAPVLLNVGWIESGMTDVKYYRDMISPSVAAVLDKLDAERIMVARALGCEAESLCDWLRRVYGASGDGISACLRTVAAYQEIDAPQAIDGRYVTEDVPCGLVPVESAARALGLKTPFVSLTIDLANAVSGRDYRAEGRSFDRVWLTNGGLDVQGA